mgnify:CR=1 FL=1
MDTEVLQKLGLCWVYDTHDTSEYSRFCKALHEGDLLDLSDVLDRGIKAYDFIREWKGVPLTELIDKYLPGTSQGFKTRAVECHEWGGSTNNFLVAMLLEAGEYDAVETWIRNNGANGLLFWKTYPVTVPVDFIYRFTDLPEEDKLLILLRLENSLEYPLEDILPPEEYARYLESRGVCDGVGGYREYFS